MECLALRELQSLMIDVEGWEGLCVGIALAFSGSNVTDHVMHAGKEQGR